MLLPRGFDVGSGFDGNNVGSGFGGDNVGSGFDEDDVGSGFGGVTNNRTNENDIPKNIIMTTGAAIMKSMPGLIKVFPKMVGELP